MRVFLTGASGFVGSHTVAALLAAGHEPRALVRDPERAARTLAPLGVEASRVEFVQGDMLDAAAVSRALEGCDAAIHAAAAIGVTGPSGDLVAANVTGTRNVVGGAVERGLSPVVHVSSVAVFVPPDGPVITPDSPLAAPHTDYGRSKVAAERYVREAQSGGAPVAIVYPGGVFGPHQPQLDALAGCSSSGGKKAEEKSANPGGGGGPRLKIAMVTHSGPGDTFWDIVQKGAKTAAAKDNVQFLYSADPDGGRQAQLVQTAIDQKVDGIVVTLAKPDAMKDVLARAAAAKIPVVSINSGADASAKLGALVHFGQDESVAGEAAGRQLAKIGAKKALCVVHEQGNVGLESRCAGAKKTFGGSMQNLYVTGTNMPQVKSAITAKLQADKGIDGVLTLGAPFAATAVQSAQEAGSKAKIGTFDMNKDLVASVKDGSIQFAVDQQPYLQGYEAVDELWLYRNNGNVLGGGRPVLTGPAIVTKDNADQIAPFAERGTR
ncbi:substrate-binding domain-containing protein [Spirillospora sp. NPDC049652]